ncbi:transporter substrate-binding domain-containing protein [Shewanella sedimentimangrovi]|uniref:Transporter substrate-binding domain-containing protein n=2 Tax=Shewanella sedimentimangrovi TaxID=2814293 RepID=A0ABX7R7C2_9GAMM|nr:transporter substrate-binding domain-containing protein [Shewanella sedimentimangrovi]
MDRTTGTVMRIIFLLLFALLTQAVSANQTSLQLAAEDSWPPFADDTGRGLSHELIKRAFAKSGVKVDSLVVPYSRALMMAEKGQVDGVFNVARQQSTEDRFVFGATPLFVAKASFYEYRQRPLPARDKHLLPEGTIIGVMEGYEYGDEFASLKNLRLLEVSSQQQLINLLLCGRIQGAVMYDLVASQYLKRMGVEDEIVPAFANHESNIYLAFSRSLPAAAELAASLDAGLAELMRDGEYQQLLTELAQ